MSGGVDVRFVLVVLGFVSAYVVGVAILVYVRQRRAKKGAKR